METKTNRLITIISLLIVSGFLISSLVSYFVSLSTLRSQIKKNELPMTSDNIYSEIQRDLLNPIFISSLISSDTFVRDWIVAGEKDESKIRKYLKTIQTKYGTVTSFLVSEKTKIYYHSNGVLKKIKPNEFRDKWYFRLAKIKQDYEINVDFDMANKDAMTIFINHKVYDYNKNYIGAAGVGLTVKSVKTLIEKYENDYGRQIYFVDKQGNITLHGDTFSKKANNIKDIKGLSTISSKILKYPHATLEYKQNGEKIHLDSRYLPELDWYLIAEQNEKAITKGIINALFFNIAICFLITSVVLTLANFNVKLYQKTLEKMATTDKLTGIYNRQLFDSVSSKLFQEAESNNSTFSIILFDIDDFKKINDKYGHFAGDKVIKEVASTTHKTLKNPDLFFRWGGEEFMVILNNSDANTAMKVGEKIRKSIKSSSVLHQHETIYTTVSLGVAEYSRKETLDCLLYRADKALLMAKKAGKDRLEKC